MPILDYTDDENYPTGKREHYWLQGKWEYIDIQLMNADRVVVLSRKEWEILQTFLDKNEARNIKRSDYEHLSPGVVRVIRDWLGIRR